MADADRIAAALRYQQEQNPADPLESFRSLAGLKSAYERRVQPIINNAAQTFSTGGVIGDLLRSYGEAAAPAQAAVLKGMGMPYQGPMTAPREEGVTSGESFRPMGDPQQQFSGQLLGDPTNLAQPVGARLANALKFAKPDAMKMVKDLSMGAISPMDTWHGTPHRFPPTAKNPLGEFDPMKIGTGEGAQAYGVGAGYLAEAKGTATSYRRTLRDMNPSYDGVPISNADTVKKTAAELLMKAKGDKVAAIKDAQNYAFDNLLIPEINKMDPSKISYGSLYKVDLPDEQIAKMLDWDKPLSEQAPEVQKAIAKFKTANIPADGLDMGGGGKIISNADGKAKPGSSSPWVLKTGNSLFDISQRDVERMLMSDKGEAAYTRMTAILGGQDKASAALQQAGIPGIRYLDQGSRAAPSSAQFAKDAVVGAADDLTALAKSMGLNAEVRHSGSNAGKSSYVSVFDPMTNRYIKSSFRISDHGTGPLRHQEHIHINSPADLATQKNDLFEWVKRNRTEKGVDTTGLSAPSQGTSNFVVFDPKHMNIIGRE